MFRNWIRYHAEYLAHREPSANILLIFGFLLMVVLFGGGFIYQWESSSFKGIGDALWWSLLRVSDPGYLSSDTQSVLRATLSLVLSLIGTAFLFGSVTAVMTQWLGNRIRGFAAGTTPVTFDDHLVILGWTNRTRFLVAELLRNEPKLRVVLYVEDYDEKMVGMLEELLDEVKQIRHR